jgi:hypothetical protein
MFHSVNGQDNSSSSNAYELKEFDTCKDLGLKRRGSENEGILK